MDNTGKPPQQGQQDIQPEMQTQPYLQKNPEWRQQEGKKYTDYVQDRSPNVSMTDLNARDGGQFNLFFQTFGVRLWVVSAEPDGQGPRVPSDRADSAPCISLTQYRGTKAFRLRLIPTGSAAE
jgi:hypothetical protein